MQELYQTLPEDENYIGSGRFGVVEKVRRERDNKVSNSALLYPDHVASGVWICQSHQTALKQMI